VVFEEITYIRDMMSRGWCSGSVICVSPLMICVSSRVGAIVRVGVLIAAAMQIDGRDNQGSRNWHTSVLVIYLLRLPFLSVHLWMRLLFFVVFPPSQPVYYLPATSQTNPEISPTSSGRSENATAETL
jgi:hypothetical protein